MGNINNSLTREKALPRSALSQGIWRATASVLYFLAVITYPFLKWLAALDVFVQFVRMLFMWSSPGVHAGWNFLGHFAFLTAYTWFATLYRPAWLEDPKN